ncbi:hypothetical protein [Quadrisphaera sp. KR29]|uniref:hypothetical protein n=1 Tax=Quadrisphaera sp. KR29 TaxID=3461391 RepID=UPI004044E743
MAGGAVAASATPATAGWRARGSASTAALSLATLSSRLDLRPTSGPVTPQGDSYSAEALLAAGPVHLDAVNTSSVPAVVTVSVTTGGLANLVLTVRGCDSPWTAAGTCAAGETSVSTAPVVLGSTSTATAVVTLPRDGRRHLRVGSTLTVGAGASVVVRTSAGRTGAPRDRTGG